MSTLWAHTGAVECIVLSLPSGKVLLSVQEVSSSEETRRVTTGTAGGGASIAGGSRRADGGDLLWGGAVAGGLGHTGAGGVAERSGTLGQLL